MKPGDSPPRTLVRSVTKARVTLPPHGPGLRIGLFGGSFNPPHEAHRAASLLAMKKLQLDRMWWLVTPGNPLKDTRELPSLEARIAQAAALADHPRIDVTGFESVIGTKYSCDTIRWLLKEAPGTHFVWVMGADNLKDFHRWKNWRDIFMMLPVAVVDRGGLSLRAASGAAAISFARARLPENKASALPGLPPPAWVYLHGVKSDLSSTAIREAKARDKERDTDRDGTP
jgi:nicotinate-nucleotide adenylyltransferase